MRYYEWKYLRKYCSVLIKNPVVRRRTSQWIREYGNRPKFVAEINESVGKSIEEGECKPKHHAGVIKNINTTLPENIIKNIHSIIIDIPLKKLTEDGTLLNNYLHSRHLPAEDYEIRIGLEEAVAVVEKEYNKSENLTDEEREAFRNKYKKKIQKQFQCRNYNWKSVDYNNYQSIVYLIGRSSADYAIVNRVFKEINVRHPDFKPLSLFDFGSGVGSVIWAADNFWKNSLEEYFCVDSSAHMNDLSQLVLKGKNNSNNSIKGLFYRQFLPASHSLKYDLVVSAFSLFELPSLKSRLETILTLWKKTQGYLIIIERGTNAGFQVINEARDFILEFCNNSENPSEHAAHVFAPCPHDTLCPRFNEDGTPCNFEVSYTNPFYTNMLTVKERFSYVILKKGDRPKEDPQWPRIVRPVLKRKKHVVCRMCTSSGKLQEIIFTSAKHGKTIYKCTRGSNLGDLLPIHIKEKELEDSNHDDQTKDENNVC